MRLGGIHRRFFLKLLAATGLVASTETVLTGTTGCAPPGEEDIDADDSAVTMTGYEFVVVGSGAGGGPLAANLARAGFKVLLLEAGTDQGQNINYQVPAFHAKSTEDPDMKWDFYVKHYTDERRAQQDSKFTWETPDGKLVTNEDLAGNAPPAGSKPKGILYPRAGTLGGCTAHNAMITVYPHESDWTRIQRMLGESSDASDRADADSYKPETMRKYFQLLERNEYLKPNDDMRGHSTKGWLGVSLTNPTAAGLDIKLLQIFKAAAMAIGDGLVGDIRQFLGLTSRDMNKAGAERDGRETIYSIPLAISKGKRNGPREYLLETARKHPDKLTILTGALATKVIFSSRRGPSGEIKAIGVEFLKGDHLYAADPKAKSSNRGERSRVLVSREVILAAGAYNTPQLLKLSGIGPRDELESFKDPQGNPIIKVLLDKRGVGTNLQDRYEVCVVSEVKDDFRSLERCTFGAAGDPCLNDWRNGRGAYLTNGAPIGVVKRSSVAGTDPDLFVFGAPGYFKGYAPRYSQRAVEDKKHFSWAVLKAHTLNRAGTVKLRSTDPRDVPDINFKYFDDGDSQAAEKDLQAVADGVKFAREIGRIAGDLMLDDVPLLGGKFEEQVPGSANREDARTKQFIKNEAWGHHASCTCPMGAADDPNAVLDGRFRVRGTTGLRVVDASVFPYIPGFFIVVPIYMISEKATDVILEDNGKQPRVSG